MADKYADFRQSFRDKVAEFDALPDLYKGKPMMLIPDDCDEAVDAYFRDKKQQRKDEEYNETDI